MGEVYRELTLDDFHNTHEEQGNSVAHLMILNYPMPLGVALLYLVALKVGPKLMEGRPAFKLVNVLRIFDLFQVVFNLYLLTGVVQYPACIQIVWDKGCRFHPDDIPVLLSDDFAGIRKAYTYYSWCFMVSKMTDLLDTIFMVLLKKNSQITFLHVYHHVSMVVFPWFTYKYAKAFQAFVPATINVIVHIIMYSYYFLATFGPSVQKYLWWKHHLTKLQLAQFVVIILYISTLLYKGCLISRTFIYIWLFNVGVFLCMFTQFYVRTYTSPSNKVEAKNE